MGVFVLWVLVIHMGCFIVHKLQGQRSSVRQLGLNCLLLSTNNTGCIGWPVLIATVGPQNAVLSMLLGEWCECLLVKDCFLPNPLVVPGSSEYCSCAAAVDCTSTSLLPLFCTCRCPVLHPASACHCVLL